MDRNEDSYQCGPRDAKQKYPPYGQTPKTLVSVHIRWMIRRDMPEVLEIENRSFDHPWSEEDFIKCLRQRNSIGMVAEHGDVVGGYMIYELHKNRIELLSFAVHPDLKRIGVGTAMIDKLKSKLCNQRRNRIHSHVRDSNLPAHLFFKSNGFSAVDIVKNFYEDTDDDAYLFRYRVV